MQIYYDAFNEPFINMFLLTSTWLTIAMSTSRYFAVCYPLKARYQLGVRQSRCTILLVYTGSILVNLPQLWKYEIFTWKCATSCNCYSIITSTLYKNVIFTHIYDILWSLIGVFIPFLVLAFCNICLIKALKQSHQLRKESYAYRGSREAESGHRLTTTLIAIIIMFIFLVSPSEFLKFLRNYVLSQPTNTKQYESFQIAQIVTNFLQVSKRHTVNSSDFFQHDLEIHNFHFRTLKTGLVSQSFITINLAAI